MLPCRSGALGKVRVSAVLIAAAMLAVSASAADPKHPKSSKGESKPKGSPGEKGTAAPLGGIPLPIGHEVKGLVLPDIDIEGHLRSRFEAGTAKRLDAERIEFTGLKVTSYTPENTVDLEVELPVSTFELNSRVLRSQARTTITRADFTISGDSLEFSTVNRQGTLTGNVKMVISDRSELGGKKPK